LEKPKIFFTTNATRVAGAEIVLDRLLDDEMSIRPILFMPSGSFQEILSSKNYKIIISKGLRELKRKKNKFWIISFLYRFFQVFIEMFAAIRRENPEIIYANNYTAAVYSCLPAKITRTPLVWHMHQTSDPYGLPDKIVQVLLGKVVDEIISVSETVKVDLIKIGVDSRKISVVYNSVDIQNEFNPNKYSVGIFRKKFCLDSQDIVVGTIGTIKEYKGVHILIEAIKRLVDGGKIEKANVKFLIVGPVWEEDKGYRERLERHVIEYGLKDYIIFTERINEIPQVLMDIDILVHCTIKTESFGLIIAEAMAMEKLLIAPRAGAILEIVRDGMDGFLYKAGDINELSDKIEYVINNYGSLKEVARRSRRRVSDKFSVEIQQDRIVRICQELIRKKGIYR